MQEVKYCQRCGVVIGDAYNTDWYAYINQKYCKECKRSATGSGKQSGQETSGERLLLQRQKQPQSRQQRNSYGEQRAGN